jgi:anti-sigma regulatory factor (Ser/Thr protein kinase)
MTDSPDTGWSLVLGPCVVGHLSGIRRWLRTHLPDHNRAVDAELLATELIANAIDHGEGAASVRISLAPPDRVYVAVDDNNPSAQLTIGRSRFGGHRGNGLAIIDTVSSWGVIGTGNGKTVWAELRAPTASPN